jgi:hypothetical protein
MVFGILVLAGGLVLAPCISCAAVGSIDEYRRGPFMSEAELPFTDEGLMVSLVVWVALSLLVVVVGVGMIVGSVLVRNRARAASMRRR